MTEKLDLSRGIKFNNTAQADLRNLYESDSDSEVNALFETVLDRYSRSSKAERQSVVLFFKHPLSLRKSPTIAIGKHEDQEGNSEFYIEVQIEDKEKTVPIYTKSLRRAILEHALTAPILASYAKIKPITS
jgi:hypothetical protein